MQGGDKMYTLEGWLKKIEPVLSKEGVEMKKFETLVKVFKSLNFSPKLSIAWGLYFLTKMKKKDIELLLGCDLEFAYIRRRLENLSH
jgi:hypothetical protein